MIRALLVLALLLGFMLAGCGLLDAADPKPADETETFVVACLTESRPVVLGLDLVVNDVPVGTAWERFADALFRHLDADKNGKLEGQEVSRLPETLALLTMRTDFRAPAPAALTRVGLRDYLRRNDLGPLYSPSAVNPVRVSGRRIRRGQMPTEALDQALLELLDTNKDGKLSKTELAAAPVLLAKLDADENELLSAAEILQTPSPFNDAIEFEDSRKATPIPQLELFRLDRRGASPTVAQRLLERYRPKSTNGAPQARFLTKSDLTIPDAWFTALDQDDNDELDLTELARFGTVCTPEVVLAFQLGKVAEGKRPATVKTPGKILATTKEGTSATVTLPKLQIDFTPASWGGTDDWRAVYLDWFRRFDRDGNGYLDDGEVQGNPLWRMLFSRFDADNDGKVFEKELLAVLAELEPLAAEAAGALVAAEVTEAGRGLFGLFDANRDGQLSVRELRAMVNLVEREEGALTPSELPSRLQVTFLSGIVAMPRRLGIDYRTGRFQVGMGPRWFQKMDRNRDGDVSRREFLGTDEEFRRLDLNGDGLIDVREAEAASKTPSP